MTRRSYRILLDDILHAMEKVERYTQGMTADEFEENELVTDAVLRNLEIIGEAAGNIPDALRENYPDIPWKRVIGLRNVVIHAYFDVDLTIVWRIVTVNLPATKDDIKAMRDDLPE